MYHMCGGMLL